MTMQRGQGHVATTHQSILSEGIHADVVDRVAREKGFHLASAVEFDRLVGNPTYAFTKNGKLTKMKADGGWVICPRTEKLIGVSENKDQDASANACERVFKYLALVGPGKLFQSPRQIFVSFTGRAFVDGVGGQGLATLELAKYAGITYTVNALPEQLEAAVSDWFDFLASI